MSNQVTAIDFDSQELIGKILFKHEILRIEIKHTYLIVAFLSKIIVCDVYTLKHLFKINTGDENAVFDAVIETSAEKDELKIIHIGDGLKSIAV